MRSWSIGEEAHPGFGVAGAGRGEGESRCPLPLPGAACEAGSGTRPERCPRPDGPAGPGPAQPGPARPGPARPRAAGPQRHLAARLGTAQPGTAMSERGWALPGATVPVRTLLQRPGSLYTPVRTSTPPFPLPCHPTSHLLHPESPAPCIHLLCSLHPIHCTCDLSPASRIPFLVSYIHTLHLTS